MRMTGRTRACVALLGAALLWRMLGAPINAEEWRGVKTQWWQARTLLGTRMSRTLRLWSLVTPHMTESELLSLETDEDAARLEAAQRDEPLLNVYDADTDTLRQVPLEQYVCSVVAAEMPASYHLEALKAQAVAARTRALHQRLEGGCSAHPQADICTESAHCQAFATREACRERWGDSFESYENRVVSAVKATRGLVLTYGGEPITVLYHAISGGQTEDAQSVFSAAKPYLVSVSSAGEEGASGFLTDLTLSREETARQLNNAFGTSLRPADLDTQLCVHQYSASGRVKTVFLGDMEVSGVALRRALNLRSTWLELLFSKDSVTFRQRGYGHGVGMSQAGANAMAAQGQRCADILAHYYTGTQLEDGQRLWQQAHSAAQDGGS